MPDLRETSARLLATAAICLLILGVSVSAQSTAPVTSGEQIPVPGRPVAADYGQLSEHNREWVLTQPPQTQAEFLLGAAVNHDRGATDLINKMVDDWHGKLHFTQKIDDLQLTALYSTPPLTRGFIRHCARSPTSTSATIPLRGRTGSAPRAQSAAKRSNKASSGRCSATTRLPGPVFPGRLQFD